MTWRLSDARIRRYHVFFLKLKMRPQIMDGSTLCCFFGGFINVVIWTTQAGVVRPIVLQAALGDQCKGACRSMVAYHRSDVAMLVFDQVV